MNPQAAGRCYMIGLDASEIEWVRLLVQLLRDPDPLAPELARQALEYVDNVARAGSGETAMRPAAER
jgi:hypothetical protein